MGHQIFSVTRFGGVSRLFAELLSRFREQPMLTASLPICLSNNHYLRTLLPGEVRGLLPKYSLRGLARLMDRVNDVPWLHALRHGEYDIYHPSYYGRRVPDELLARPFVITVFDMIHERLPQYFDSDRVPSNKRRLVEGAARIIAISQTTKRDLVALYSVDPGKIDVVHLGASELGGVSDALELPDRYLLFVGRRAAYKNFTRLAMAFRRLRREFPNLKLLCAGGGQFSPEELQSFDRVGIREHVCYLAHPSDEKLGALYRGATCFIYPSLYEGFGIPVLEAFGSDCPAVLSQGGALPEVGGDAALYFDPESEEQMCERLLEVLKSSDRREDLASRGRARLTEFSWAGTALGTLNSYRRALGGSD